MTIEEARKTIHRQAAKILEQKEEIEELQRQLARLTMERGQVRPYVGNAKHFPENMVGETHNTIR